MGRYLQCMAVLIPMLASSLHAGPAARQLTFEIGAGEASETLRKFAEQSGQEVIYPPELVDGVQTAVVKGHYTAREALEHMLAGSSLSVWQDAQTGALAIGKAAKTVPVVALPPFLVTDEMAGWRYARIPGSEILSRCSDRITTELIAQDYGLHELLKLMLPARLQFRSVVPTTFLYFSDRGGSPVSNDLLNSLQQRAKETEARQLKAGGTQRDDLKFERLPNYTFRDRDAESTFCVWMEGDGEPFQLRLEPAYVRFLLTNRAPSLPPWFIEGMMEVYDSVTMRTSRWFEQDTLPGNPDDSFSITFHPMGWVSADLTRMLVKNPRTKMELLPLEELFSDHPMAILDRARSSLSRTDATQPEIPDWLARQYDYTDSLRLSEAAWFIRWALNGEEPRRRALWNFVERASTGRVSEAMFRECFGIGYREMEAELRGYLSHAVGGSFTLRPEKYPELDPIEMSDATNAQISRIKGDFNRLEIAYVRARYPVLTSKYVEQARRTLHRAYDAGERDPRLLAELGLCECDAGNDAAARSYLESAVQAKVPRPRAYYELARIRFAAFRGENAGARITPEQRDEIIEPLLAMQALRPALEEGYELMAEAWIQSGTAPDKAQLAALETGLALFPRQGRLILSVVLIKASQGRLREALALVVQGLKVTDDSLTRARLLELQGILSDSGEAPPK
jgi:hypothetical protein